MAGPGGDDRALAPAPDRNHRKAWVTRRRAGAQQGNANAAKHLSYSMVRIAGEVAELVDWWLETAGPRLDATRDGPALAAAARLSVRARKAFEEIELAEAEGRDPGESLHKRHVWLQQAEMRALAALSLTPATRTSLELGKMDVHERLGRATSQRLVAKYRTVEERS